MRWLAFAFSFFFGFAGLKALFVYDANAVLSRPTLILLCIVLSSLFFFLFRYAGKAGKEESEFEQWLVSHEESILGGGARYKGILVRSDTQLTRFLLTASFIFMTIKLPSRYYIAGKDSVIGAQIGYILATALIGWWGIPWGPVYTVQALFKNLTGGYRTTVHAYLTETQI